MMTIAHISDIHVDSENRCPAPATTFAGRPLLVAPGVG
jgi:hypothetical protein